LAASKRAPKIIYRRGRHQVRRLRVYYAIVTIGPTGIPVTQSIYPIATSGNLAYAKTVVDRMARADIDRQRRQ
jgi:hypothetical protein